MATGFPRSRRPLDLHTCADETMVSPPAPQKRSTVHAHLGPPGPSSGRRWCLPAMFRLPSLRRLCQASAAFPLGPTCGRPGPLELPEASGCGVPEVLRSMRDTLSHDPEVLPGDPPTRAIDRPSCLPGPRPSTASARSWTDSALKTREINGFHRIRVRLSSGPVGLRRVENGSSSPARGGQDRRTETGGANASSGGIM